MSRRSCCVALYPRTVPKEAPPVRCSVLCPRAMCGLGCTSRCGRRPCYFRTVFSAPTMETLLTSSSSKMCAPILHPTPCILYYKPYILDLRMIDCACVHACTHRCVYECMHAQTDACMQRMHVCAPLRRLSTTNVFTSGAASSSSTSLAQYY